LYDTPFAFHHVGVELGRAADGLAGVVDDEVEAREGRHEVAAEGFDAGGVAEVEAEDLEAVAPIGEVGFPGVALGGVAGEAGGDDEVRAGAEEFDAGLVADFDASAGEEGVAAAEVREFGSFCVVEVGAVGAHLVIEVVDDGEVPFADVAVVLFGGLSWWGLGSFCIFGRFAAGKVALGRVDVGGGEDGLAAEGADAGLVEQVFGALGLAGGALTYGGLEGAAELGFVGIVDFSDEAVEAFAEVGGEMVEESAIGGQGFEEFDRGGGSFDEAGWGWSAMGQGCETGVKFHYLASAGAGVL
jgi:hypothetical protein